MDASLPELQCEKGERERQHRLTTVIYNPKKRHYYASFQTYLTAASFPRRPSQATRLPATMTP